MPSDPAEAPSAAEAWPREAARLQEALGVRTPAEHQVRDNSAYQRMSAGLTGYHAVPATLQVRLTSCR
jgi:hypothetical protein